MFLERHILSAAVSGQQARLLKISNTVFADQDKSKAMASIAIMAAGEVLLLKRTPGGRSGGCWDSPEGK